MRLTDGRGRDVDLLGPSGQGRPLEVVTFMPI